MVMRDNAVKAMRRSLFGLAAVAASFAGASSAYGASFGCDNGGFFTSTYSGQNGRQVPNFDIGDRLTFTVTSISGGTLNLSNSANVTRLSFTAPGTKSYTVANADDAASLLLKGDDAGFAATVTSSCNDEPSPSSDPDADNSPVVAQNFVQSRVNTLMSIAPGGVSLMNRSQNRLGGRGGRLAGDADAVGSAMSLAGLRGAGSDEAMLGGASGLDERIEASFGSRNFFFNSSLSQMRREAAARSAEEQRMALGGAGGALPDVDVPPSPWEVWLEGRYSSFQDDTGDLDRSGKLGVLHVGADYRVSPDVIIGGVAAIDWSREKSSVETSKVDGAGWMAGPYLSARLHENLYFDLRATWGQSSNDIDVAGATGSFDTVRWLVNGALSGVWRYDAWRIEPSVDLAYMEERSETYTNSAGTVVPGQSASVGRLQFGPELGYRFAYDDGVEIEPFASIKGVWTFNSPDILLSSGEVVGASEFRGRLEGGLDLMAEDSWSLRASGAWDGLGDGDFDSYTLQTAVSIPLN